MRAFSCMALIIVLSAAAFGQTFEISDVHVSPRSTQVAMRTRTRPGRYELHNATMLDLIRTAHGYDSDKILGGPNWLEYDRFDVIAKIPSKPPDAETLKLMLQDLLADRFKLVVRKETQPVSGLVLSQGKGKPKMKESDGKGETGCMSQPPPPPPPPSPVVLNLPIAAYSCHNMTMEAFAASLKNIGAGYVTNAVVNSTGLQGTWDFDLKFTQGFVIQLVGSTDAVTLSDAIDKQLGLKLEEKKIPTPVLIVEKANEMPTDNSPEVAKELPPARAMEFDVADIKPSAPITAANIQLLGQNQPGFFPGGRVNLPRFPLMLAIQWGWNLVSNDDIIDPPKWLSSTNFDIIAKAPSEVSPVIGNAALQDLGPMLQALLIDRFKMKAHFEDRQVNAYTLVAAKPKLKKADPNTRTSCKTANARPAAQATPFGGIGLPARTVTCQNMTMAQFADQLQILAQNYVHYPVTDSTGLEGAWDFSFTYSPINPTQIAGLRGAPPPGAGPDAPAASDPVGGTSLFDTFEKQLGLKLEIQKRKYPGLVIDHIEEKPTEN
jgi:uncharacterized protein (TIGR03435 family)